MPNVKVLNMQGAAVGEIALADDVFGVEAHVSAMHTVVRAILNAQRQGTQSARTRTEVRGGGPPVHPRRRGLRPQAPFLPHQCAQGHPPSGDEERALLQGHGR